VQVVKPVDAGGGFLRHALDRRALGGEPARCLGQALANLVEKAHFLVTGRHRDQVGFPGLDPRAHQDVKRRIAAIVEDHVAGALGELEDPVGIGPVILEAFALDRKDRHAALRNRGGGVVLGREDVARGPAHLRAKRCQRLDQHRGLHRHVQAAGDAGALQRLCCAKLLAQRHQARHFGFGDIEFLAAIAGKGNVLDDVIRRHARFSLNSLVGSQIAPPPPSGNRAGTIRAGPWALPRNKSCARAGSRSIA